MLTGALVALVTPMACNGDVDFLAIDRLVDWHLHEQTQGLVLLGTTGEAACLSLAERQDIVTRVVSRVAGRIPVWVGTGTNSTLSTIELTSSAKRCGADGALVVTPYYNKPTQEGLLQHFSAVAEAVDMPIMLYNVPSRTAVDLLPETVCRLSAWKNVVAIKEATGEAGRLAALLPSGLRCFSGDDASSLAFVQAGGHGVVSVASNVEPLLMSQMIAAALQGSAEALAFNDTLMPLYSALFVETNPIPVKWLLAKRGQIQSGIRLPLTPLSAKGQEKLNACLADLKMVL